MREKELKEDLATLAYKAEADHEVQMVKADLYKIAKYSIKLHEMFKMVSEEQGVEGWVQSKITKAADYMGSVYHHLDYEMKFDEMTESRKEEKKDEPKKDDPKKMDVTDADKKLNTPAYKRMKDGDKRYNDKTTESYLDELQSKLEQNLSEKSKGLYHNVNKRKKAGTSRPKGHKDAPTDQDWKNASKTAKESKETKCPDCDKPSYTTLPEEKQKGVDGKVCWKGYKRMGTKKKNGKTVDNCVKM